MTIDEPTLVERPFTDTHDRILHALVERVHDMSLRLDALEAAPQGEPRLVPPDLPEVNTTAAVAAADRPSWQSKTARSTGWQPARR